MKTLTKHVQRVPGDEQGAVLVQVAIAILVLTAMTTFVVDHGVSLVSRGQAQNAADAGALSGAIARAFDELTDPPASNGAAFSSAMGAALANNVWTSAPTAQVSWACPAGVAGSCVRVDVYRNGEFGSTPLPTIFGKLLNISSQGVRATATARVASGNATNCMRPFAVADKWIDNVSPALNPAKFERWQKVGSVAVQLNPKDVYVPPSSGSAGTGYTIAADLGAPVTLKRGNPNQTADNNVEPGWTLPVRLPDGDGGYLAGASDYNAAIKHCLGSPVSVGQYLPTEDGVMSGPTSQGVSTDVDSLINQDSGATWNTSTNSVEGTCAPTCAPSSPRIVPIAVFDMDEYQWRKAENNWTTAWEPGVGPGTGALSCPTGGSCIRVTNILGFFVDGMSGDDVVGHLASYPGEFVLDAPSVGGGAAFLVKVQLVR
jgi:Putative Flp pilus-assembly TadE/G-like